MKINTNSIANQAILQLGTERLDVVVSLICYDEALKDHIEYINNEKGVSVGSGPASN